MWLPQNLVPPGTEFFIVIFFESKRKLALNLHLYILYNAKLYCRNLSKAYSKIVFVFSSNCHKYRRYWVEILVTCHIWRKYYKYYFRVKCKNLLKLILFNYFKSLNKINKNIDWVASIAKYWREKSQKCTSLVSSLSYNWPNLIEQ